MTYGIERMGSDTTDVGPASLPQRPRRQCRRLLLKRPRHPPILAGECHYCRRKIKHPGNLQRHLDVCGDWHMARGIDLLVGIAIRRAALEELADIAGGVDVAS